MNYEREDLLADLITKFRNCDYSESNGFTFSIESKGASGGNCWGSEATPFRKNSSTMVDDMQDDIQSGVESFLSLLNITLDEDILRGKSYSLAEQIVDSYYDTDSHNEYYGNYSEYNKYFVSITEVLDFIEDTISPKEKEDILDIASEAQDIVVLEKIKESKFNYLQDVNNKITDFEKNSSNEQKHLKNQLERAKKEFENISSKLENLEKTQSKNLVNLKKTKKELTDFLGQDYIDSKIVKKKHGY